MAYQWPSGTLTVLRQAERPMHRFIKWRDALNATRTVAGVRSVMREYLDAIGKDVLSELPERFLRQIDVEDIPGCAIALIREELQFTGDQEAAAVLHEVAHTFVAASNRIAAIQARGQPIPTTLP